MKLDRFLIEDVRCFAGPQDVRIRPLTFLVGENSTGKTTVLGCMQALADYMWSHSEISFNRHPYEMGSFREIVRRSNPLLPLFKIGIVFRGPKATRTTYVATLRERRDGARADVAHVTWTFGDASIVVHRNIAESYGNRRGRGLVTKQDRRSIHVDLSEPFFGRFQARPWMLPSWLDLETQAREFIEALHPFFRKGDRKMPYRSPLDLVPSKSIAPVRSRPKRTYDPFLDAPDAEGTDIPAELASIARKGGKRWQELKERLESLGKDTGLFSELMIKKMGKSGSDPFQVQVKIRGPRVNLKDVGYGVSQALPILVHVMQSQRAGTFLIQQPEVHLHPRAQAELSSILISLLNRDRRRSPLRFVIETHSDYMLDRARIAIRQGLISPDDVSFVYFEPRSRKGTRTHNIRLNEMGNLENVPASYRQFFLKETNAFLGLDEQ